MNINKLFRSIESSGFIAELSVASDFRTLMNGIKSKHKIKELFDLIDENNELSVELFVRAVGLAREQVDDRYLNRWDIPLTIYLWMVDLFNKNLSKFLAIVIDDIKNCFWANKLARYIKTSNEIESESAGVLLDVPIELIEKIEEYFENNIKNEQQLKNYVTYNNIDAYEEIYYPIFFNDLFWDKGIILKPGKINFHATGDAEERLDLLDEKENGIDISTQDYGVFA